MKLITKIPLRQNITIELTPEEQDIIFTLTLFVGGDLSKRRKTINELADILRENGAVSDLTGVETDGSGIYFD